MRRTVPLIALLVSASATLAFVGSRTADPQPATKADTAPATSITPWAAGPRGELQLSADVDDVQIFIDARFVGETGRAGTQLLVRLPVGPHEVRVTATRHADLVGRIDIELNKRIRVRGHLIPLAGDAMPPPVPSPPLIGVGQTVRTKLVAKRGGPPARASWRFEAEAGDRILLGALYGSIKLFEVRSDKSGATPVLMEQPEHLSGPLPVSRTREFTVPEAGTYNLTATASPPKPAPLVFALYRAPPPIPDPAKFPKAPPGRRLPSPKR